MFRTLATALDGATGADIPAAFAEARDVSLLTNEPGQPVEQYGFRRGRELLIAFWRPGITGENGRDYVSINVNVSVKSPAANQATLIDVLNGTETPLNIKRVKNDLLISNVHAESWPRILRISE